MRGASYTSRSRCGLGPIVRPEISVRLLARAPLALNNSPSCFDEALERDEVLFLQFRHVRAVGA